MTAWDCAAAGLLALAAGCHLLQDDDDGSGPPAFAVRVTASKAEVDADLRDAAQVSIIVEGSRADLPTTARASATTPGWLTAAGTEVGVAEGLEVDVPLTAAAVAGRPSKSLTNSASSCRGHPRTMSPWPGDTKASSLLSSTALQVMVTGALRRVAPW